MVTQTVIPDKCATILIHQSSKNWNKWIAMLGRLVVPSSKVSWKFTKLLMKVCIQYVGRVCLGNKLQNVRTWIHTLINILAAAVEEVQKLQTLPQWHSYHQEKESEQWWHWTTWERSTPRSRFIFFVHKKNIVCKTCYKIELQSGPWNPHRAHPTSGATCERLFTWSDHFR